MRSVIVLKGLAGKTMLITGAAGNIGAEAVKPFIEEGCNVVASDISAATCIAAADSFGGLDLAFINAGVECKAAPVADFDLADYERVFGVNVKGAFLTALAVVCHGGVDPERRGALLPRRDLHRRWRHDGLTRASGEPGP